MTKLKKGLKSVSGSTWAGILLIIFFAFAIRNYLGFQNVMNILKNTTALLVVSVGMTMAILLGEIDMSVGGIITISATVTGIYLKSLQSVTPLNVIIAVLISCLIGIIAGAFNGYMIGIRKYNFWLVTFGTMSLTFGISKGITNGGVVNGFDKQFQWLSNGTVFKVSMSIIWTIIICIIATLILYKTRFGFHIYAIGDSESCAINSGINVKKTRFFVYTMSGLMAGLAGVLLLARTNSAGATIGEGYEFNSIAAVVIGGTAMEGGKGGFKGTIFGAIFIAAMKNGLQLIGLSNYWQQVSLGIVILAIILYDVLDAKVRYKKSLRRVYSHD